MIENISLSAANSSRRIEPVKRAELTSPNENKAVNGVSENRDEYIPSEEKKPIGLYGASPDEKDTTTANTDNVDREIKSLREKERALMQKLRSADESTAEKLKRELEQVAAELAQKDNDEYRKQNAVFT